MKSKEPRVYEIEGESYIFNQTEFKRLMNTMKKKKLKATVRREIAFQADCSEEAVKHWERRHNSPAEVWKISICEEALGVEKGHLLLPLKKIQSETVIEEFEQDDQLNETRESSDLEDSVEKKAQSFYKIIKWSAIILIPYLSVCSFFLNGFQTIMIQFIGACILSYAIVKTELYIPPKWKRFIQAGATMLQIYAGILIFCAVMSLKVLNQTHILPLLRMTLN